MPYRHRILLAATICIVAGVGDPSGPAAGESESPSSPQAWALMDDFEDVAWPDPGLWSLPADPDATWRPSNCQAKHGQRSLRAFAGARGALEEPCNAAVAPGALRRLTMRLDLTDTTLASRLDLFFELWLLMPAGDDQGLFIYLVEPQDVGPPTRIPIFGGTGMGGLWAYPRRLDLMNLDNIDVPDQPIDLRGGVWDLEWVAYAPRGAPAGGGVYIDNVSLVWEPDPAVPTPTVRPTVAPSATWQPTDEPTPTPRPTMPATVTPAPSPPALYLPLLGYTAPATPTPEASNTPFASRTPDGSETPGATPTDAPPGTPIPSVTATATPPMTGTPATASPSPVATASASPSAVPTSLTPSATPGPLDWHVYLPVMQLFVGEALSPTPIAGNSATSDRVPYTPIAGTSATSGRVPSTAIAGTSATSGRVPSTSPVPDAFGGHLDYPSPRHRGTRERLRFLS